MTPIIVSEKISEVMGTPESKILFTSIWNRLIPDRERVFEQIDEFMHKYAIMKDDRAMALVGGILLENYLDNFLRSIVPKYKSKRYTFQRKIDLAKSLCLIEPDMFNCLFRLKEIRNDFAHDLEMWSFNDVEDSKIQLLKDYSYNIFGISIYKHDKAGVFKTTTTNLALFLESYTRHVNLLNNFIRSEQFHESLQKYYELTKK